MLRSIELDAANPKFLANHAAVCRSLGKLDEAKIALEQSLGLNEKDPVTWNNLGNVLGDLEDLDGALNSFRKTLQLDPNHPNTRFNMFRLLSEFGDEQSAVTAFREALELSPNPAVHSDFLFYLHYPHQFSAAEIFHAHQEFDQLYARHLRPPVPLFHPDKTVNRKLKIGYVSHDFRRHPVTDIIEPLLANHDHTQFEILCYSDGDNDSVQQRIRSYADQWIETRGVNDKDLSEKIIADKVDILVELSGHTRGNRLLTFARRPAPVQVTFIGYPNTTGLSAIDYRLTDHVRDPSEKSTTVYSETSIWLPQSAWCYSPSPNSPEVRTDRFAEKDFLIFGSLNNVRKITREMIQLWCQILQQIPNSKLRLSLGNTNRPASFGQSRMMYEFQNHGIGPDRLLLQTRDDHEQYLKRIGEIDIALDTFPYQGGITTLDTLWMGTPVIVLAGEAYVSRVSVSILHYLGLDELVANSAQQYVELAVQLANDKSQLQNYHATLRDRLKQSCLMDGKSYAKDVEHAYREMWTRYCRPQSLNTAATTL